MSTFWIANSVHCACVHIRVARYNDVIPLQTEKLWHPFEPSTSITSVYNLFLLPFFFFFLFHHYGPVTIGSYLVLVFLFLNPLPPFFFYSFFFFFLLQGI